MAALVEGSLEFSFLETWVITKYDDWPFYQNRFKDCCCGNKAVDFLALEPNTTTLWLIEVKDYRQHRRNKGINLWDEIAVKARDTLAGLFAAKANTTHEEQSLASRFADANALRIVLHLEQPRTHSKLFPRAFDLANVELKLKQLLKPIDAHPKVVETGEMRGLAWTVVSS
jgi:hypothetical protein